MEFLLILEFYIQLEIMGLNFIFHLINIYIIFHYMMCFSSATIYMLYFLNEAYINIYLRLCLGSYTFSLKIFGFTLLARCYFRKKSKVPCINLTFSGVLFLENIWQYRYMIELNLLELHMYIFTLLYIGSFYI